MSEPLYVLFHSSVIDLLMSACRSKAPAVISPPRRDHTSTSPRHSGKKFADDETIWRRCGGDVAEMWRRCGGDVAEMWRRCGGDVAEMHHLALMELHERGVERLVVISN
jgi:hypothetical protein